MFGRFFRGSNARGPGSGLGLAIVKEVAAAHGASLSIDRGPGGVGTTVQMVFAYERPAAAAAQPTPAANGAASEPISAAPVPRPLPR